MEEGPGADQLFISYGSLRVKVFEALDILDAIQPASVSRNQRANAPKESYQVTAKLETVESEFGEYLSRFSTQSRSYTSGSLNCQKEEFIFSNVTSSHYLKVTLYAMLFSGTGRLTPTGTVTIPINRLEEDKTVTQWYSMMSVPEEGQDQRCLRCAINLELYYKKLGLKVPKDTSKGSVSRSTSRSITPARNIPLEASLDNNHSQRSARNNGRDAGSRYQGSGGAAAALYGDEENYGNTGTDRNGRELQDGDGSDEESEMRRAKAMIEREEEDRKSRKKYSFDSFVEATTEATTAAEVSQPVVVDRKHNNQPSSSKYPVEERIPRNRRTNLLNDIEEEKIAEIVNITKTQTFPPGNTAPPVAVPANITSNDHFLAAKTSEPFQNQSVVEKKPDRRKRMNDLELYSDVNDASYDVEEGRDQLGVLNNTEADNNGNDDDGNELNESLDDGNNVNNCDGYSETASEITDTDSVASGKKKKSLLKKMAAVGKFWDRSNNTLDSNKPKSTSFFKGFGSNKGDIVNEIPAWKGGASEKLTKSNVPFSSNNVNTTLVDDKQPFQSKTPPEALKVESLNNRMVSFADNPVVSIDKDSNVSSVLTIDVSSPEAVDTSCNDNNALGTPASLPAIPNTPARANAIESMSKETLPIGLVDYFVLLGPTAMPVRNPGKSSSPAGSRDGATSTVGRIDMCQWDRFPATDHEDVPLPLMLEWFACPEGSTIVQSSTRPKAKFSSYIMNSSDEELYGICLTFFIKVGTYDATNAPNFTAAAPASVKKDDGMNDGGQDVCWYEGFADSHRIKPKKVVGMNKSAIRSHSTDYDSDADTEASGLSPSPRGRARGFGPSDIGSLQTENSDFSANVPLKESDKPMSYSRNGKSMSGKEGKKSTASQWASVCICLLSRGPFVEQLSECLEFIYQGQILPHLDTWEEDLIYMSQPLNGSGEESASSSVVTQIPKESALTLVPENTFSLLCSECPVPIPGLFSVTIRLYYNDEFRAMLKGSDKGTKFNATEDIFPDCKTIYSLNKKDSSLFTQTNFFLSPQEDLPTCPYPIEALFRYLGPRCAIDALACAFAECKLLFHSNDVAKLPIVCESVRTLLSPLRWTGVFLPLVPSTLLELVEAPVPFMLGILSSNLEHIHMDYLSDVVVVDCDLACINFNDVQYTPFPSHVDRWFMTATKMLMNECFGVEEYDLAVISPHNTVEPKASHSAVVKENNATADVGRQLQIVVFDVMVGLLRHVPDCLFFLDKTSPVFNRPLFLKDFVEDISQSFLDHLTVTGSFNQFAGFLHDSSLQYFIESTKVMTVEINRYESMHKHAHHSSSMCLVERRQSASYGILQLGDVGENDGGVPTIRSGRKKSISSHSDGYGDHHHDHHESHSTVEVEQLFPEWVVASKYVCNKNGDIRNVLYFRIGLYMQLSAELGPKYLATNGEKCMGTPEYLYVPTERTSAPSKRVDNLPSKVDKWGAGLVDEAMFEKPRCTPRLRRRSSVTTIGGFDYSKTVTAVASTHEVEINLGVPFSPETVAPPLSAAASTPIASTRPTLVRRATGTAQRRVSVAYGFDMNNLQSLSLESANTTCASSSSDGNAASHPKSPTNNSRDLSETPNIKEAHAPARLSRRSSVGSMDTQAFSRNIANEKNVSVGKTDLASGPTTSTSIAAGSESESGSIANATVAPPARLISRRSSIANLDLQALSKKYAEEKTSAVSVVPAVPPAPTATIAKARISGARSLGNDNSSSANIFFGGRRNAVSDEDGDDLEDGDENEFAIKSLVPLGRRTGHSMFSGAEASACTRLYPCPAIVIDAAAKSEHAHDGNMRTLYQVAVSMCIDEYDIFKKFRKLIGEVQPKAMARWGLQNSNVQSILPLSLLENMHSGGAPSGAQKIALFLQHAFASSTLSEEELNKMLSDCADALTESENRTLLISILKQDADKSAKGLRVFPVDTSAFEDLGRLSNILLQACSAKKDYMIAHQLLEIGGSYFHILEDEDDNLDKVEAVVHHDDSDDDSAHDYEESEVDSVEAHCEFLSERICHHPLYQSSQLWFAVILDHLPLDSTQLAPDTPAAIKGKSIITPISIIFQEARGLLYRMKGVGVNIDRALLFLQAVATDYKLEMTAYFDLQRFASDLWDEDYDGDGDEKRKEEEEATMKPKEVDELATEEVFDYDDGWEAGEGYGTESTPKKPSTRPSVLRISSSEYNGQESPRSLSVSEDVSSPGGQLLKGHSTPTHVNISSPKHKTTSDENNFTSVNIRNGTVVEPLQSVSCIDVMDGWLVSGCRNGSLFITDLVSEKHINKVRHNMTINCVQCLPGGGGFASAGEDGLVKLFRFPTRRSEDWDSCSETSEATGISSSNGSSSTPLVVPTGWNWNAISAAVQSNLNNIPILNRFNIAEMKGHHSSVQAMVVQGGVDPNVAHSTWSIASGDQYGTVCLFRGNNNGVTSMDGNSAAMITDCPAKAGAITSLSRSLRTGNPCNFNSNSRITKLGAEGYAEDDYDYLDSENLAAGTSAGHVVVIDTSTGRIKYQQDKGHTAVVTCVLHTKAQEIVTCSVDRCIKIWDLRSNRCVSSLGASTGISTPSQRSAGNDPSFQGANGAVTCLSVGGLNNTMMVSASSDNLIRVWDTRFDTTNARCTLKGHSDRISSILWNGGEMLRTSSLDGTVRSWDPMSGVCKHVMISHENVGVTSLCGGVFSPNVLPAMGSSTTKKKNWLVTNGLDGCVRVWSRLEYPKEGRRFSSDHDKRAY